MSAPKDNQFWKLRLKHGRSCAIETPEELWNNFIEYAEWMTNNPLIEIDYKGATVMQVEYPKMRPFTKSGFALACGLSGWEIIKNWRERKGFSEIIDKIEGYIHNQKFEGAAAGLMNPNIIARELGLSDKQDVDHSTKGEKIKAITVNIVNAPEDD